MVISAADLTSFTKEISEAYDRGEIKGPLHLNSDTQIEPLLKIFKEIEPTDWVLSTWRSTYHALLKGVPRETVFKEVLAGRSMQLHFPEYRFMSSAIMGGMLPIACGLAAGGHTVHCFIGDMCFSTGAHHDAAQYIFGHKLPVRIIVEDNKLSTNTPTFMAWRTVGDQLPLHGYQYERTTPHYGTGSGFGF